MNRSPEAIPLNVDRGSLGHVEVHIAGTNGVHIAGSKADRALRGLNPHRQIRAVARRPEIVPQHQGTAVIEPQKRAVALPEHHPHDA